MICKRTCECKGASVVFDIDGAWESWVIDEETGDLTSMDDSGNESMVNARCADCDAPVVID